MCDVLFCNSFFLTCGLACRNAEFFRDGFTDLEIFFNTISCEIRRLRLLLIFFWAWRSHKNSDSTCLGWSRWAIKSWSLTNTLTLGFFLLILAWPGGFLLFTGLRLIIRDMFFRSVSIVELLFLLGWEALPFFDDFGDQFRFSHSWKLVTILVVLLTRKLSVQFCQLFFL